MRKWMHFLVLMAFISLLLGSGLASAQPVEEELKATISTAFTFQGYLKISGSPANGSFDFSFSLYSDNTGTAPVGSVFEVGDVPVTDGLFRVLLDFGAAFDGEERYLQISVRPGAETGAYTTLAPLQTITPTPYALFALQAGSMPWGGLVNIPLDIADGDNDTLYTAGIGLDLNSGQFSLQAAYRLPSPCLAGQTIKWISGAWQCANDNDTTYEAWTGLEMIGSDIQILLSYRLPQTCSNDQVAKWYSSGQFWQCANDVDTNTTYTPSTGLELVGSAFQIGSSFQLPQTCSNGQVTKWNSSITLWECANDTDVPYTAGDGIDITAHLVTAKGTPYQQVVIVAKSGGDSTSIQGAINTINDASETNPYLVWVAPGVYNEKVIMKPYVDIQGAGENMTTIYSGGFNDAMNGVVKGADHTTLRDLSILSDAATGGGFYPIGLYMDATSMTVQNVTITAQNVGLSIGIYIRSSSPLVENVTVNCKANSGQGSYCVFIQLNSKPVFRNLTVSAQDTGFGQLYGLYNVENSETTIDGLQITLSGSGGIQSAGIKNGATMEAHHVRIQNNVSASSTWDVGVENNGSVLRLVEGKIEVYFGYQSCRGVYSIGNGINYLDDMDIQIGCAMGSPYNSGLYLSASTAIVRRSKIDGAANKGVEMEYGSTLEVYQSQILGGSNTILTSGTYNIRLADTQLSGGNIFHYATGTLLCTGVYDENLFSSGLNVCPP